MATKKGKDKEEKLPVTSRNALQIMAERLNLSPDQLKGTLKNTILKNIKKEGGGTREATDSEFIAFIMVANAYKLNPMLNEIYAFPNKSGGIIPIIPTDGWTRLITTHPNYKNHTYEYSEDEVDMKGAQPCPEWIEITIEKKDGSVFKLREYIRECFRDTGPWKSHTSRMLRHKTKIQGGRDCFGFGGIYDVDEGERIIEAEFTAGPSKAETVEIEEEETPEITHDTEQPTGDEVEDGELPLGEEKEDLTNKDITPETIKKLQTLFGKDRLDMDREMRLANISVRMGRKVGSIKELNEQEGQDMLEVFNAMAKVQGK